MSNEGGTTSNNPPKKPSLSLNIDAKSATASSSSVISPPPHIVEDVMNDYWNRLVDAIYSSMESFISEQNLNIIAQSLKEK